MDTSWTHLLARPLVRPLIGTRIRPNHITSLRLLSGLGACLSLGLGTHAGTWCGGWLWLLSAFLDRADGELARLGNMMSPAGHRFDYLADICVNACFFVGIGFGLRHSWLGDWAILLGLISGASMLGISLCSEWLEADGGPQVLGGTWGFDPDDAFYLMAPLAWLGWLMPILLAAAIVTPTVAVVLGIRLQRRGEGLPRDPGGQQVL
jgi:archaetidylinositol phosphate synthase